MNFTTVVKPRIIEAKTKQELIQKIIYSYRASLCYSYNYGACYKTHRNNSLIGDIENIIAFNLEKHRPKKKQSPRAKYNGINGQIRKTKITEQGFWRAYVYKIPASLLTIMKKEVNQNDRNFEMINKK